MRFVLGIIAGALATLFIATAMDAPTDRIVDQFVSTGLEQWRKHTSVDTAASLDPTERPVPTSSAAAPAMPVATVADPDTTPLLITDDPEIPGEYTALAPEEPTSTLPTPQTDEVEATYPDAPQTYTVEEPQQAVVWAPFHSEASARGFAARLTNQLAHPFTVSKTGPANYLVTYEYRDEPDRMELEQQIAYVTGAASP